jgi:hypothetical protein
MGFTIPAVIGDYLPLEVKLNIVREVAFNSIQLGARHASGLPLHFPRINPLPFNNGRGGGNAEPNQAGCRISHRSQNSFAVFLIGLASRCAKNDEGRREGQT